MLNGYNRHSELIEKYSYILLFNEINIAPTL